MATGVPKTNWNGGKNALGSTARGLSATSEMQVWYSGKTHENEILSGPTATLVPLWGPEDQTASVNRLVHGDNLPVLRAFLRDPCICGKVRLVYIDPPFATGSVFQSRSQTDAYSDFMAGSQYIEFLRQRLVLLREILAPDGSIYVHLDHKMAFHAKLIMDEVFGSHNFRNWITRKKCNPKNYTRKAYGCVTDFMLFYTKTSEYVWNRPYDEWTPERAAKEYQYVETTTGRRYKKVPVHAPGVRNGATGQLWRGKKPPPGKHWQYRPRVLDEMDARGEIYWSPNGNPRRKSYLDASRGIQVQDIWLDFRDAHNQNIKVSGYPTEKNPDLLSRIVKASSREGDIVLDCFSGSGTTLSVASRLGRSWIGVDNSPVAIGSTLRRFAKGLEPMGDYVSKSKCRKDPENDLPLFGSVEGARPIEKQGSIHRVISDFSLLAEAPYQGELDELLAQWREWVGLPPGLEVAEPSSVYKARKTKKRKETRRKK